MVQSTGKRKVVRAKQKELEQMTLEAGDPETLEQVRPTPCFAYLGTLLHKLVPPEGSSMVTLSSLALKARNYVGASLSSEA